MNAPATWLDVLKAESIRDLLARRALAGPEGCIGHDDSCKACAILPEPALQPWLLDQFFEARPEMREVAAKFAGENIAYFIHEYIDGIFEPAGTWAKS